MRKLAALITLLCISAASADSATGKKAITIPASIPYAAGAYIQKNIQSECDLPGHQVKLLSEQLQSHGFAVRVSNSAPEQSDDLYLKLEISNASSGGNAFIGHHKGLAVSGHLFRGSQELGNFIAYRHSGGGVFGGFKGSCSVLYRCADAIGADIAEWLDSPSANAKLGNAQ